MQLPDVFSKEKRSQIMSKIRGQDTKLDQAMESILKEAGFDYEKYPKLFGRPDFTVKPNIAIFCDSGFWHGGNWKNLRKQLERGSNPNYWINHISKNRERDRIVTKELKKGGHVVLRFWGDVVSKDKDIVVRKIIKSGGMLMARLEKPRSIEITVRDRKIKPSKSFMIYDTSVEEAVEILIRAFEKLDKKITTRRKRV